MRAILLAGLLAWAVGYVLLAYGNPGPGIWMFYLAIILHGVCFDFFFVTGQLYTDQQAPSHLRSTAQGFITTMTYGVGMFIGSFLSGYVLDYFTTTGAGCGRSRLERLLDEFGGHVGCDRIVRAGVVPHARAHTTGGPGQGQR